MRATIRLVAPCFSDCEINGWTVFLGFPLGPDATSEIAWQGPLAKLAHRTRMIISTGCHPTLATALFNLRAVSCLSFMSMFFPPPTTLNRLEIELISKLFHTPGVFFSRPLAANMRAWLGTHCLLPSAHCWAVLARAAKWTFMDFYPLTDVLTAIEDILPYVSCASRHGDWSFSPRFWKTGSLIVRIRFGRLSPLRSQTEDERVASQLLSRPGGAGCQKLL